MTGKRINKISVLLSAFTLVVVTMMFVFSINSYAASSDYINKAGNFAVLNGSNYLSKKEMKQLAKTAANTRLLNKDNGTIVISFDDNSFKSASDLADDTAESYSGNLIVIEFNMNEDNREFYIRGSGDFKSSMTSSEANSISDAVYSYFSKGDFYNGLNETILKINRSVTGELIISPLTILGNLIVGMGIAFALVAIIIYFQIKRHAVNIDNVLASADAKFPVMNVDYKTVKTWVVTHNSSSDSGGGGGSFSSGGGGGSSGGGHSF